MTTGIRSAGNFCWINILTAKPAEAKSFFGTLLGWGYVPIPGMGDRIQIGGHDIGGLFDLHGTGTPQGAKAQIGVMIKVDAIGNSCSAITSHGGKAMDPMDIGDQGRMAVCFDPSDAEFDLWQPLKGPGTNVDSMTSGAPSWFELATSGLDGCAEFYSSVFGWGPEAMPLPGRRYLTFKHGEGYVAGMFAIESDMGDPAPGWRTYFTVTDIDTTWKQALELGATERIPISEIDGVGRFGGLLSPQGVPFHIISYQRKTDDA